MTLFFSVPPKLFFYTSIRRGPNQGWCIRFHSTHIISYFSFILFTFTHFFFYVFFLHLIFFINFIYLHSHFFISFMLHISYFFFILFTFAHIFFFFFLHSSISFYLNLFLFVTFNFPVSITSQRLPPCTLMYCYHLCKKLCMTVFRERERIKKVELRL